MMQSVVEFLLGLIAGGVITSFCWWIALHEVQNDLQVSEQNLAECENKYDRLKSSIKPKKKAK